MNDVISALEGSGEYQAAMPNLRVIARINPFPVGLYVKEDSGLKQVADLAGKSVPAGWDGFPIARSHITAILAAGGLTWDDVDKVPVPELIRGSDDMASGRVDSAFFSQSADRRSPKSMHRSAGSGSWPSTPIRTPLPRYGRSGPPSISPK
ncbi:TAXI family TRAP transporter solute-binding subunit [Roseibium salinum]|nr:TAXI family TRAP transporter solute-binding subunit [Roseibium salinum]